MLAYLLTVWLCKISIKLCRQKSTRYMFCKWRNAIFRPIKYNPERNATIVTTRFFYVFLTAPESFLLFPAFAFLFSTITVMPQKKYTICSLSFKSFSVFLLWSHIFSLLKVPVHIALTAHTSNFLINGANTNDFKEFLMRLLRNSFVALNMSS